jgi:hypothetical protein
MVEQTEHGGSWHVVGADQRRTACAEAFRRGLDDGGFSQTESSLWSGSRAGGARRSIRRVRRMGAEHEHVGGEAVGVDANGLQPGTLGGRGCRQVGGWFSGELEDGVQGEGAERAASIQRVWIPWLRARRGRPARCRQHPQPPQRLGVHDWADLFALLAGPGTHMQRIAGRLEQVGASRLGRWRCRSAGRRSTS